LKRGLDLLGGDRLGFADRRGKQRVVREKLLALRGSPVEAC
jgi:hypothetical protein